MTLLDLLKAKWTIYGLDAPTFAWLAAVGLLVFTGSVLARLIWLVRREERSHQQVRANFWLSRLNMPLSRTPDFRRPSMKS